MQIPEVLNTVIHGDCLEVMKQMPNESVDLVVTSPPYNLRHNLGGGFKNPDVRWENPGLKDGYDGYADNMPYKLFTLKVGVKSIKNYKSRIAQKKNAVPQYMAAVWIDFFCDKAGRA